MNLVTNDMRIAATQFVVDILNTVKSFKSDEKSFSRNVCKIRDFLPKFTLHMSFCPPGQHVKLVHRYFTYLSRHLKGKKRVYVSREKNKNDLYILYVQKERLMKLCKRDCDGISRFIVDLLGNKWIIVNGINNFNNVSQLMSHTIAVERDSSRQNYPPHTGSSAEWICSDELVPVVSRYRSSFVSYNIATVELESFSFTDECKQII